MQIGARGRIAEQTSFIKAFRSQTLMSFPAAEPYTSMCMPATSVCRLLILLSQANVGGMLFWLP